MPASTQSDKQEIEEDDNYKVPRTFIAPDDFDATKSTIEELEEVVLIEHLPDQKVYLGMGLTPELRKKLI